MTEEEIRIKLLDRTTFERSLETTTLISAFSKFFYLIGGSVITIFVLFGLIDNISRGKPFLDTNLKLAFLVSSFLILVGFICQRIGKKINYKVYDTLYDAFIENPIVIEVEPIFKSKAVGYWAIAKDQSKQKELEQLLKSVYDNNAGIRRNIDWALKTYAAKNRALKDNSMKKKIIKKDASLANFDFQFKKSLYEFKPKYFIHLKTTVPTKNYLPFVDQFFEIDIDKLY